MTIGHIFSAVGSGLLAGAMAVASESGLAVAALSYMLGGGLGVSVFVALVEFQSR